MFFLFPIIITPFLLIPITYRYRYSKFYLFLFIIGVALIALRYTPFPTDDAAYHYKAAYIFEYYDSVFEWLRDLLGGNIYTEYEYRDYPVFGFLLYIFSGTGTYSIISFFVAFIVYYIYCYIIVDIYKNKSTSKVFFILSIIAIIAVTNYRYTLSGMRYSLATAIVILLFYRDYKKNFVIDKTALLYIIPSLIHPSMILYIIFRFVFSKIRSVNIFTSVLVVGIFPLILLLANVFQNIGIPYLEMLSTKIIRYQDNEAYQDLYRKPEMIRLYAGVALSILFILFYKFLEIKGKFKENNRGFYILTYYISLFSIGISFFRNLIDRSLWFVYPMVIISLFMYVSSEKNIKITRSVEHFMLFAAMLFICFMGIVYNKNFQELLNLIDFSITDIFTKNLADYFSNLPRYSLSDTIAR